MRIPAALGLLAFTLSPAYADIPKPAALIADVIPALPDDLATKTRAYMEYRTAGFVGWHPSDRSMLIATRFGNVTQLHRVARPMGARRQISFEAEPVSSASWAPKRGDVLVVEKDVGGGEFYQIYTLANGQLRLLTDGKSRNSLNEWSDDGSLIGYSSTKRNGTDNDLYVMDPRDPATSRLVAQVKGGGWAMSAIANDKKSAIIANYVSVQKTDLYRLSLDSGQMVPIGDHSKSIAYSATRYAPDGTLWAVSDEGSEFARLGTLDPATGKFAATGGDGRWDVEDFEIAADGSFIAYVRNEGGASALYIMDLPSRSVRRVSTLPAGVIGRMAIAQWGDIGLSLTSARSATDAYSVDPKSLALTRWTESETGGLDTARNVEPELVEVAGFDKKKVSGFLYRPDPTRFPGKRPLIVSIHGGPEGQSRPNFIGRNNYLLNEMGVALFLPNVRGSTGYGKTFVGLDNGPFKREDSVKDIGSFLDRLSGDASLDASHFAVTGGSYGGYMCYASAIAYGKRLKAANCIVAISDFVTFLENTQSYRRDLRRVEYGDERDPKQRAKLKAISPMTRVGELTMPLMVVTGGNDPRVPASEADQIIKAIRAKGGTAWHLLGTNEGHGFAKKENVDYQFWASLQFWKTFLLGE